MGLFQFGLNLHFEFLVGGGGGALGVRAFGFDFLVFNRDQDGQFGFVGHTGAFFLLGGLWSKLCKYDKKLDTIGVISHYK